jgi:3-hydroxybutyryl-CoA dehydrogenase
VTALQPDQLVGVVGAGTMGTGIAQVAALEQPVAIYDAEPGRAAAAVDRIGVALDRLVDKGRLDRDAASAARSGIRAVDTLAELAPAALVIEAVVEDLAVKRDLFAALEDVIDARCILATNTSSLSITELQATCRYPGRVVGMHFFNPPPVMGLVEVVHGLSTERSVLDAAAATAERWGKTAVRCGSSPGFIVNRVARPFYGEAQRLLEERAADPATIDAVLRDCAGFPMGPFELMDLIGHDVNASVSHSVWEQTGYDPRYAPSSWQRELVAAGRLGRKIGRGVYDHREGAQQPVPNTAPLRRAPRTVVSQNGYDPLPGLLDRIASGGVRIEVADLPPDLGELDEAETLPPPGLHLPSGGTLLRTDGDTATAAAATYGVPVVMIDWVRDASQANRFCIAPSDGCPPHVLDEAVGLLQATGAEVSIVDDAVGLIVARTVAMLVNEAYDVVLRGVASKRDVDRAMRLGAGHPLGPFEWIDLVGVLDVVALLDGMHSSCPTGRYRVSPRLRRSFDEEMGR